ncbi:TIGR03089 family protein [Gordonia soli]|uniref:TIGR03089 family protein n=1 Tax=Gordonia soli NBRC 108243 TaxID=1223545 RepID=M0QMW1_9ACTN|nr:TIGR03089 family protein [Gordonia soli]GAC69754.1 hypothetical protein GS4_28_00020 [Gordonia soli NBRC 108243]
MTDTITGRILDGVGDWSQPLLTFYDDATGERTELSAATLGNWAAKTANLIVDEVGLVPGDEVLVDLPEHWQTAAILLGAWWSGAHVRTGAAQPDTAGEPVAAFTSVARLDAVDADEVYVASLDPFALPVRDLPPGVADFGTAARVHGDQYRPRPAGEVVLDGRTITDVAAVAARTAAADGVGAGARVLSTRPWADTDEIVANLVSPLLAGASLIAVVNADDARIEARAESEKATLVLR